MKYICYHTFFVTHTRALHLLAEVHQVSFPHLPCTLVATHHPPPTANLDKFHYNEIKPRDSREFITEREVQLRNVKQECFRSRIHGINK